FSFHASEQLTALIAAAQQHHVDFIYAISPGLDMTFSSPREVSALKRKLEQIIVLPSARPACPSRPTCRPWERQLLPGMDVLWTGPKVVSHKISVESIEEVSSVLRRAPVLWDNIHANDYDPQRLFLGPYKDRPTELISRLRGVLTNPNCEFHPNFVAVHTLASWCRAPTGGEQRDVEMG
ncbi:unnamed protein product, partial [Tetraodon nigroviridis]